MASPSSDIQERLHVALYWAEQEYWWELYDFLEKHNVPGLVNALPARGGRGLLHEAAWHGWLGVCEALIENYDADPQLRSGSGELASEIAEKRGFPDLAKVLREHERIRSAYTMPLSVVLASGEALLSDVGVNSLDLVLDVIKLATSNLPIGFQGSISRLSTAEGRVLEATASIADAALTAGSILTATVVDDELSLDLIEQHLHELILQRSRCEGHPEKLTARGFVFPSVRDLCGFIPVPGMYGAFSVELKKEASGVLLQCSSVSRVVGVKHEQYHEITAAGVRLVA